MSQPQIKVTEAKDDKIFPGDLVMVKLKGCTWEDLGQCVKKADADEPAKFYVFSRWSVYPVAPGGENVVAVRKLPAWSRVELVQER